MFKIFIKFYKNVVEFIKVRHKQYLLRIQHVSDFKEMSVETCKFGVSGVGLNTLGRFFGTDGPIKITDKLHVVSLFNLGDSGAVKLKNHYSAKNYQPFELKNTFLVYPKKYTIVSGKRGDIMSILNGQLVKITGLIEADTTKSNLLKKNY